MQIDTISDLAIITLSPRAVETSNDLDPLATPECGMKPHLARAPEKRGWRVGVNSVALIRALVVVGERLTAAKLRCTAVRRAG